VSDHVITVHREPMPSRVERFEVGDWSFTASLLDPPGRDAVWHIRLDDDDHGPITVVVADHLADGIADLESEAARQRARAQVHLDLADDADRQRSLVEALTATLGAADAPATEPVDPAIQHATAKPSAPAG
jgi:hypothetical protein